MDTNTPWKPFVKYKMEDIIKFKPLLLKYNSGILCRVCCWDGAKFICFWDNEVALAPPNYYAYLKDL